jgi:hypothetical protein
MEFHRGGDAEASLDNGRDSRSFRSATVDWDVLIGRFACAVHYRRQTDEQFRIGMLQCRPDHGASRPMGAMRTHSSR